jgi:SpoVK/Ycf46/Vps4 family AAA+-type ATPase
LLYGGPGTGKTASVKQIARTTGRAILMVDIAKIQSKWVGESEKNLSKVFEEYRNGKKAFANDPILLFNEADAILGKRFSVKSSVDKSYNAMQNILLQELEDFEGILWQPPTWPISSMLLLIAALFINILVSGTRAGRS